MLRATLRPPIESVAKGLPPGHITLIVGVPIVTIALLFLVNNSSLCLTRANQNQANDLCAPEGARPNINYDDGFTVPSPDDISQSRDNLDSMHVPLVDETPGTNQLPAVLLTFDELNSANSSVHEVDVDQKQNVATTPQETEAFLRFDI